MLKALALDNFWGLVFSKKKSSVAKKSDTNNLRFFASVALITASVVLLMSYIYGVNNFSAKGYEIKALQKSVTALSEENKKINLKISEAGSMVSIQSGFTAANFVPAGTPRFLEVKTNQFTQR